MAQAITIELLQLLEDKLGKDEARSTNNIRGSSRLGGAANITTAGLLNRKGKTVTDTICIPIHQI